jgi:hypothetical protein
LQLLQSPSHSTTIFFQSLRTSSPSALTNSNPPLRARHRRCFHILSLQFSRNPFHTRSLHRFLRLLRWFHIQLFLRNLRRRRFKVPDSSRKIFGHSVAF